VAAGMDATDSATRPDIDGDRAATAAMQRARRDSEA